MIKYFSSLSQIAICLVVILLFASCSKRKELEQIGCVKGKSKFGGEFRYIGAMSKQDFLNYLDTPTYYYDKELIDYEMRWEKTDNAESCPSGI